MPRETEFKGRVLVVDDNEMNVDLLSNVLKRRGYETVIAMSGKEALEKVQQTPLVEIILLDINMPEMSGYEVCEVLKADERVADIPVIFISALDDLENVVKGFDVGGVDYITKPFKAKEVTARVSSQLQVYRAKKEIEEMRERDRQQFQMIDKMRQQFIGSATHDLKNPLFIVGGYLEILATMPNVAEDKQSQDFIAAIRRGVTKMQGLVFDMLDLLQMDKAGKLELAEHDLNDFLTHNLQDMRLRADEKQIQFTIQLPNESVTLRFDAAKLARVLDNLVSNAIKYTPEGGKVDVIATVEEKQVSITVKDTGFGIPEEILPKLFQPFQRVNTTEHMEQEGSGLGLSIVKAIVEQHGGTISAESVYKQGSTFRVTLLR